MDLFAKSRVLVLNCVKFCLKLTHWRLSTPSLLPKPQNSLESSYLNKVVSNYIKYY